MLTALGKFAKQMPSALLEHNNDLAPLILRFVEDDKKRKDPSKHDLLAATLNCFPFVRYADRDHMLSVAGIVGGLTLHSDR